MELPAPTGDVYLLSLVRGSLQHKGDFQQSVVIFELIQNLQQEDDGAVHMRRKTARTVDLVYWNTPDALDGGGGGGGGKGSEDTDIWLTIKPTKLSNIFYLFLLQKKNTTNAALVPSPSSRNNGNHYRTNRATFCCRERTCQSQK